MTATINEDTTRYLAAVELVSRLGATNFNCHSTLSTPPTWSAAAIYRGRDKHTGWHPQPAIAVEELLRLLLSGGQCPSCRRATVLGATALPGRCAYVLRGDRYHRSCDRTPTPGAPTT